MEVKVDDSLGCSSSLLYALWLQFHQRKVIGHKTCAKGLAAMNATVIFLGLLVLKELAGYELEGIQKRWKALFRLQVANEQKIRRVWNA